MERRGCGLGCIIAGLGLVLSCCLAPYLISSIYSIITSVLQVPSAPNWLWGDWINTLFGDSEMLYMMLAEGPICCVGAIALLIIVLGLVLMIGGIGQEADEYYDGDEYTLYEQADFDYEQGDYS